MMITGDLLREARLRAGLSQSQLGDRAGVPRQQVSRWERGIVEPSFETVRRLVRACGLELTIGLANADREGHDAALIERELARTPRERFRSLVAAVRGVQRIAGG